ncbi:MAG: hypothetical protein KC731_16895 [Myxococcales bacterium]|nr:hypothetical protein [Myxococcales bacterium]
MDYPIVHERFQKNTLTVRPRLFGRPLLFRNGEEVPLKWLKHEVEDDEGRVAEVRFAAALDLQPRVTIDGGPRIAILPPLPWYTYLFAVLPFPLFTGGALGGFCGGVAVVVTLNLFRSQASLRVKIASALGTTGIAYALYFVVAAALRGSMGV